MTVGDVYVELRATIADFQAKFAMASDQITALEATQSEAAAGMAESAGAVGDAMGREAETTVAAGDEMSASLDRSSISAARFAASIDSMAAQSTLAVDKMSAELQANMVKMQLAEDKAAASNEAVGVKMAAGNEAASAGALAAAGKYALAGAAVAALGGISVDMAAKYQTLTTRLVTSAGETQANLKTISDGMLQMAGQVGISADQLATGMYTVESAGYHGAEGLKVLQAAAQGAKDEGADLTTVADAVSTALTDYHLPASDAATVTSQLVTAVGQGKTTMQDFSGALHSITPLAADMHISLADVTGTLAEMTSHGMSADQASQNLAETLRTLQKPSSQATAALSQIHMTVNGLQDSLSTKGLQGTLESISQAILEKMGPSGKVMLNAFNTSKQAADNLAEALKAAPPDLQKLGQAMVDGSMTVAQYRASIKALPVDQQGMAAGFLSLIQQSQGFTNTLKAGGPQALTYSQMLQAVTGNATTMNTALMVTGENSAGAQANIRLISGATADAQGNVRGFADIQQTLNQKLDEAKAGFGALAISIGEKLMPAVSAVVGWLATAAQWLAKHQTLATILAAGLGLLTVAMLGLAAAMWVASLTPITLIIAGIVVGVTALAVGVYELISHWKDVAGFFASLWHSVAGFFEDAFSKIGGFLKQWGPLILTFIAPFIGIPLLIAQHWGQIVSFFQDIWKNVSSAFMDGVHAVVSFFEGLPGDIGKALSAVGSAVADGFKSVLEFFADLPNRLAYALGYAAGTVVKGAILIGEGLYHGVVTAAVAVWNFFTSLPGRIVGFFVSATSWLETKGHEIIMGALNGIADAAVAVWNWFTALPGEIVSFLKDANTWLGTKGRDLLTGMWNGIVNGAEDVWNWLLALPGKVLGFFADVNRWLETKGHDLISGILNGIKNAAVDVWNWFMALPGNLLNWIGDAGRWLFNVGSDILHGLWNGLSNAMSWLWDKISSLAGSIVSGFKNALGISSPSRVMAEEIGQHIPAGIAMGIQSNSAVLAAAARNATQQALAGSRSALSGSVSLTAGLDLTGNASVGAAGSGSFGGGQAVTVINVNVAGSAVTEKELAYTMQTVMTQLGQRNSTTYRNYKR